MDRRSGMGLLRDHSYLITPSMEFQERKAILLLIAECVGSARREWSYPLILTVAPQTVRATFASSSRFESGSPSQTFCFQCQPSAVSCNRDV